MKLFKISGLFFSGLSLAALFSFYGCFITATEEVPDTKGPSLSIDAVADDTVTVDTMTITGTASDTSGVARIEITLPDTTAFISAGSGGRWSYLAYLTAGENSISVKAVDEEDNNTTKNTTVYYKAEYFKLDTGMAFRFIGPNVNDSVTITVLAGLVMDNNPYYTVKFVNTDWGLQDSLVLLDLDGVFKIGSSYSTALVSPDTLFFAEYTAAVSPYDGATVRFVGDTVLNSTAYRNCVKVTFSDPANQLVLIKDYYLVPDEGIVSLRTSDTKPYSRLP